MRLLAYGGSVISEAVVKRAMKVFPDAEFVQAYGMTEMSPCMTYLSTGDHRSNKPGILRSAGRATLTTQVRIVDSQGGEVPCGTVGEVAATGPRVMTGPVAQGLILSLNEYRVLQKCADSLPRCIGSTCKTRKLDGIGWTIGGGHDIVNWMELEV